MAIVGLGTDIVEIKRMQASFSRLGGKLVVRILTKSEQAMFAQKKDSICYLAKRFCAKEAAAKALGTGIAQGVSFQDFIISNDDLGKPVLSLQGKAKILADEKGVKHIHLSISDEQNYTTATVILES